MWTECQPGSEHLSRLPESSETELLGMGSLLVKKRYFSPLPISLFTAAELLTLSPPYMFLIFALPVVTALKHSYEGQSHRLQAKRAAVSCCCRKGSGQKCLCASCLQRKINDIKNKLVSSESQLWRSPGSPGGITSTTHPLDTCPGLRPLPPAAAQSWERSKGCRSRTHPRETANTRNLQNLHPAPAAPRPSRCGSGQGPGSFSPRPPRHQTTPPRARAGPGSARTPRERSLASSVYASPCVLVPREVSEAGAGRICCRAPGWG